MRFKVIASRLALAGVLLFSMLAVGLATSILTVLDVFPVPSVARTLVRMYTGPKNETGLHIDTTLVGLKIESVVSFPPATRPQGGGLTSFEDEIVVVNNDGLLYVYGHEGLAKLSFAAPYNGYNEYVQTSLRLTPEGYRFNLDRLRYNDVLVVDDGEERRLLVSYIEWVESRTCYRNAVSSIVIPGGTKSLRDLSREVSWKRVYETEPCLPLKRISAAIEGHMAGGKLAVVRPGVIAMTSGEFHWDGVTGPPNPDPSSKVPVAQDPQLQYGKVLEIDWRSGGSKTLTRGNRNMQGIAVTPDQRIWTVEHGPRGGDKLNLHIAGRNFGWPIRTYGTQYNTLPYPGTEPVGRMDGFDLPAFAWLPSIGVSGLTVVSGFDPVWNGDLLAASLRAASLFRIRIEGDRAVYAEQISIGRRIRAVHQHKNGVIALWTDDDKLMVITADRSMNTAESARAILSELNLEPGLSQRVDAALNQCAECHSFEPVNDASTPSLAHLIGRGIGAASYQGKSQALERRGGRWTSETLEAFLADPQAFAPGSGMPSPGLDPNVRKELVRVFKTLADRGL